jgi:hypothetical protein
MLATLLIVFREVIEAGLIVGIVLAASKGVPRRAWWVGYGVIGGLAGAPSGAQLFVYAATIVVIVGLMRLAGGRGLSTPGAVPG